MLAAYDQCLKCSHLFNVLDSRGVISVTERATLIGRVRQIACRIAKAYLDQRELASAPPTREAGRGERMKSRIARPIYRTRRNMKTQTATGFAEFFR